MQSEGLAIVSRKTNRLNKEVRRRMSDIRQTQDAQFDNLIRQQEEETVPYTPPSFTTNDLPREWTRKPNPKGSRAAK